LWLVVEAQRTFIGLSKILFSSECYGVLFYDVKMQEAAVTAGEPTEESEIGRGLAALLQVL